MNRLFAYTIRQKKTNNKYYLVFKNIFLVFFIGLNTAFAQVNFRYDLIEMKSDYYYYNFEYKDNELYIGTDQGILIVNTPNNISIQNKFSKGYVYLENNKLVTHSTFKGALSTPYYNKLLPLEFQSTSVIGTDFKNYKLIISKGKLFIFKRNISPIADSLSIRSISKNYIGSYSGIFYKGSLITYPKYTTGYIREFPNETFVCYDGLIRIVGNNTIRYESSKSNTKIGNSNLGNIRDIFKINKTNYLLFTESGLYVSDLKNSTKKIIATNDLHEPKYLNSDYRDGVPIIVYVAFKNSIYKFDIITQKLSHFLSVENNLGEIKDAIIGTPYIYLITNQQLIKCSSDLGDKKFSFQILKNDLNGNHQIEQLNNLILLTANDGLHCYNIDTRDFTQKLINTEFNNRAVYVDGDTIYLGSIHGYYKLTPLDIANLLESKKEDDELNEVNYLKPSYEFKTIFIFTLIGICIFLASMIIMQQKRWIRLKSLNKQVDSLEIHQFIKDNLNKVTIDSICQFYKITPIVLYEILDNEKPGEIIKSYRLDLIKRMRKEKKSEEEISKLCGFSISYLKKIR